MSGLGVTEYIHAINKSNHLGNQVSYFVERNLTEFISYSYSAILVNCKIDLILESRLLKHFIRMNFVSNLYFSNLFFDTHLSKLVS